MPQLHLPMFPNGVIHITEQLAVMKKDGAVTYFNGHMPVFSHGENDINTFRMITSQFCVNGAAKQSDIIRTFGVTSISVKRSVKTYREKGPKGFYAPRVARGAAVLVDSVVAAAEASCRRRRRRRNCREVGVEAQHAAEGDTRRKSTQAR
jgi:hypothetical protein